MGGPVTPQVRVRLEVDPIFVRPGRLQVGGVRLRRFQEEVLEAIRRGDKLVYLSAPTGSGKTVVPLLPLIFYLHDPKSARRELKLAVDPYYPSASLYPSRTLLDDQTGNIEGLIRNIGGSPWSACGGTGRILPAAVKSGTIKCYTFNNGAAGTVIVRLHSESLDSFRQYLAGSGGPASNLYLLSRIYNEIRTLANNTTTVFTVTLASLEYLTLLLEGLYGSMDRLGEIVRRVAQLASGAGSPGELIRRINSMGYSDLQGLPVYRHTQAAEMLRVLFNAFSRLIFIDEAHLYDSHSSLTLLVLLALHLGLWRGTSTLVLASATHSSDMLEKLGRMVKSLLGVEPTVVEERGAANGRGVQVRKRTIVEILGYPSGKALNSIQENLAAQARLPDTVTHDIVLEDMRRAVQNGEYALILGDRLYYLRQAAARAYQGLGGKATIYCVDSLARLGLHPDYCQPPPASGGFKPGSVIVGSSSVSYGVDIPSADLAVVYGKTASDILQRLGRTGRRVSGRPEASVYIVTGAKNASNIMVLAGGRAGPLSIDGLARILEQGIAPPPRKTPGLNHVWLARAVAALASTAVALRVMLSSDYESSGLKSIIERAAELLEDEDLVDPGDVERGMRLLAGANRLSPRLAYRIPAPRHIVSLSLRGANGTVRVPMQQYLRLYALCDTGGLSEEKYEYYISIPVESAYDSVRDSLRDRALPVPRILDIIEQSGAGSTGGMGSFGGIPIMGLATPGSTSKPVLVQVSPDGISSCGLDRLKQSLSDSAGVFIDYSWAGRDAAAYMLLTYYTAPSIPVLAGVPDRWPPNSRPGFAEIVGTAGRIGLILVL
ncbi:MAG: hypothetical protein LRS48_03835 [Desulfurococcales archaeon]|nr:hypothetical protein [Desulfurococcales archaeon]